MPITPEGGVSVPPEAVQPQAETVGAPDAQNLQAELDQLSNFFKAVGEAGSVATVEQHLQDAINKKDYTRASQLVEELYKFEQEYLASLPLSAEGRKLAVSHPEHMGYVDLTKEHPLSGKTINAYVRKRDMGYFGYNLRLAVLSRKIFDVDATVDEKSMWDVGSKLGTMLPSLIAAEAYVNAGEIDRARRLWNESSDQRFSEVLTDLKRGMTRLSQDKELLHFPEPGIDPSSRVSELEEQISAVEAVYRRLTDALAK